MNGGGICSLGSGESYDIILICFYYNLIISCVRIKPVGIKLVSIKPIGIKSVGMKPFGMKPVGIKPVPIKSVGWVSVRQCLFSPLLSM